MIDDTKTIELPNMIIIICDIRQYSIHKSVADECDMTMFHSREYITLFYFHDYIESLCILLYYESFYLRINVISLAINHILEIP